MKKVNGIFQPIESFEVKSNVLTQDPMMALNESYKLHLELKQKDITIKFVIF